MPAMVINTVATKFKQFLPAGPVASGEPGSPDGMRVQHLVQFWSDPGGLRTVAVANLHINDPGKSRKAA